MILCLTCPRSRMREGVSRMLAGFAAFRGQNVK